MGIALVIVELYGKTESEKKREYHEKFAGDQKTHQPHDDLVEEVVSHEICMIFRRCAGIILLCKMNDAYAEQGETS